MMGRITAAEIAKIAGVSRSTVTGVVNDYSFISDETKKRVKKIIEEYGYEPHMAARNLAGKNSKILGLFIYHTKEITDSHYYSNLIIDIINNAQRKGYTVMTCIIKSDEEKKISKFLQNGTIQGTIISGGRENEQEIRKLLGTDYKMVLVDQMNSIDNMKENIKIVNRDNFRGAYLATDYLIKMGHSEILYISGSDYRLSAKERLKGYKKALEENKIIYNENLILDGDFSDKRAENTMNKYLENNPLPSALFAVNDMSAIGAIRAIKKRGYRIPNDISVIGFDDIYISSQIEPKLTTIKSSSKKIALESVEKLVQMIDNNNKDIEFKTLIDVELIERDTVKKKD
ncbi:MAG: LacI family transcriptional regulator [Firmicutes bacterium]|nr:LacI family transcriptional regulator [Bacillota bacterium]